MVPGRGVVGHYIDRCIILTYYATPQCCNISIGIGCSLGCQIYTDHSLYDMGGSEESHTLHHLLVVLIKKIDASLKFMLT